MNRPRPRSVSSSSRMRRQLNVWDVPSAIVAGGRFKFMVGVRCSAGCCLAGQGLGVFDQQGSQVGAAKLGSDIWPETDALYVAEVEARSPAGRGSLSMGGPDRCVGLRAAA